MIDVELISCPLCNYDVQIMDLAGWEIQCDCGISFSLNYPECESKEDTIKAWNTRVDTSADE